MSDTNKFLLGLGLIALGVLILLAVIVSLML